MKRRRQTNLRTKVLHRIHRRLLRIKHVRDTRRMIGYRRMIHFVIDNDD